MGIYPSSSWEDGQTDLNSPSLGEMLSEEQLWSAIGRSEATRMGFLCTHTGWHSRALTRLQSAYSPHAEWGTAALGI